MVRRDRSAWRGGAAPAGATSFCCLRRSSPSAPSRKSIASGTVPHSSSGCHVKQNCVGLQSTKPSSSSVGIFFGIEREVLRSKLVATSEVNGLYLTFQAGMTRQGHDAEHACRWRKEVEFHSQRLPFLLRTFRIRTRAKSATSVYLGDAFAPRAGDAGRVPARLQCDRSRPGRFIIASFDQCE